MIADPLECPIRAEFKIVKQKGAESVVIIDDLGYSYAYQTTYKSGKYKNTGKLWRCSKKKKGCKANVITENELIIEKKNRHNHDPTKVLRLVNM